MQERAEATKGRILNAAFHEFAKFGLAGARVDRIASSASANKRAIYEYFGNKAELFDIVVVDSLWRSAAAIPERWDDVPRYVSDIYDYFADNPDLLRLNLWRQLERPEAAPGEVDFYRRCIASLGAARPDLSSAQAVDLFAVVWSIHHSWLLAPRALQLAEGAEAWGAGRMKLHRASMVESLRLLTGEAAASGGTRAHGQA
ncbi:TetR/AcrR family transcriptional regulator [Phycicoccus sp. Root101]|uniref:TetR/AcrR family transcriptional regulator n=1 Tax=Phycicoccus sp. Root101 TaxID=1736421 RepID=UPI0007035391|nr:TetR family transcriptional regulator [Phycicoccus sp. Root101]KQU68964.1 hypothetical protein ASC58_09965 [Phycicoccus sp. Root101]